jgi:hypothetical protein
MDNLFTWTAIFIAFLLLLITHVIYQLHFHPLSKFPGPKLAALTTWYEGYYDIIKKGRFTFELGDLHDKYGESSLPRKTTFYVTLTILGPNHPHRTQ